MWLAAISSLSSTFVHLLLAALFGAALGLERTLAGKHAGVRTYALVSLGSALFVTISELVITNYASFGNPLITLDPLRIPSQVVVGIGFLGTGLIIFRDSKLSGLTTAAGLWVAAGIGVAAGFGLTLLAGFAAILTLLVFTLLWRFEQKIKPETNGD